MIRNWKIFFTVSIFVIAPFYLKSQQETVIVSGKVIDVKTKLSVENVNVKLSNSFYRTVTNKNGEFSFLVNRASVYKIIFSHLAYQGLSKEVKDESKDTIFVNIALKEYVRLLDSVSVVAIHKPETIVGKPNFSIFDFDFFDDKLILLTAERNLNNAKIQLSDYEGNIISWAAVPKYAGEAKQFFHDYEGFSDLICKDSIFRIDVWGSQLILISFVKSVFEKYTLKIYDTLNENFYYDNNLNIYPSFNYYYVSAADRKVCLLQTVTNEYLLKLYNMEYYYLPSRMQLQARRMADYYKIDFHIAAALMSGFIKSMYYDPLYAPLFILQDTICVFNHHNDFLYHYNKQNDLIDSVPISYHHPKNWRTWKKKLYIDEAQNKVYAFFSKDGRHFLKQIDFRTGKEVLTYKLKNHSGEKIKIKDGYVYYVYRPFDSVQEKFLYREKIE